MSALGHDADHLVLAIDDGDAGDAMVGKDRGDVFQGRLVPY
jgi:hypothetical protein